MEILEVLDEKCMPHRGTKYSACIDLKSRENIVIPPKTTKIIPLGVKLNINTSKFGDYFLETHYLELNLRSSMAVKGLIIANGIGVIDLDYPNEIGLIVYNTLDKDFNIKAGERVAQCSIKEHKSYMFGIKSDDIREGGFGSTNKKD